jgi:uncharacterized protein YfaS (alpha-2-macroglobulin family)
MRRAVFFIVAIFSASVLHAANTLRVVSAGPSGELASLAEGNEIRVVFSEPMVTLGRIPQPVRAPFFRIDPPLKGTFRWSGTDTLIFTPDPPLPYATRYEVAIDAAARSVAGNTLAEPYRFSFTTPTVRLLRTNWYRKPNRAVVIGLRFNQPIDRQAVLPRVNIRTVGHEIEPVPPSDDPAFAAKLAQAKAAAASNDEPVFIFLAPEWTVSILGEGSDLLVVETRPGIPPDTHLRVQVNGSEYRIELEPTLFVRGLGCASGCDPDDYNTLRFRTNNNVQLEAVQTSTTVTDVTDPANEKPIKPTPPTYSFTSSDFSFDTLGYTLQPARRYRVDVAPHLTSNDGQILGYRWSGTLENWHRSAFISFGDGQGVWESTGGPTLPFHARNLRSVKQWLAPLELERLMPTLVELRNNGFRTAPKTTPQNRRLNVSADRIQSFGVEIAPAVGADNRGLLWAAMQATEAIPRSHIYDSAVRATIVQATNLGISVKDSPQNTLILVTRLDDAQPVPGASVSIRTTDNKVVWSGVTNERGIAFADVKDLRKPKPRPDEQTNPNRTEDDLRWERTWRALSDFHFIVVAEKDGDLAYVGSDWTDGITPWEFGLNFDISEAEPLLRGTVFSDRGVYKLGEEIHFKAILRSDTPDGMQLLTAGTKLDIVLTDAQAREIDKRTLTLNEWSSSEWTYTLPVDGPLGDYMVTARVPGQGLRIAGTFLVAAYRRPDFRVDTTLTASSTLAGTKLEGKITGRYLYGGAMSGRDVKWTYSKRRNMEVPERIRERFPQERFTFLGWDWSEPAPSWEEIESQEATLNENGELPLDLATDLTAGWPFDYRLEGEVTDVTRQTIAGRAVFRTDPAPWYIGVRTPPYFADASAGIDTEVVAVGLDGLAVAGVPVKVQLHRIQWNSVRRAIGNGFYEWDTRREEVDAGSWDVTSAAQPVALQIPLSEGGQYRLTATARDADGRSTTTRAWFYASGVGYTAWERYDHPRIELVAEKTTYRPGETAKIMIKSPWETATALLTTEREGVRTSEQFPLTSTQQTVTVPITERDIPNIYVSVLLVKGRTEGPITEDVSDPGKPALRLGYIELKVEDATKRLQVAVKANREEYRPATKARIEVAVRDAAGKPSQSEVTLWAVDYGVLSLTAYQTPDVLESIYLEKALQVINEDSRQRIVSRRVITPKGSGEGGGGGRDAGPGTLRRDFRVLAFWLGSVVTDARGVARRDVTLPESLTTYRIMAVAGDRQSRFGWGQAEIKINKPLMLTPAFPRFMTPGDTAHFGGVVHVMSRRAGKATVTISSVNPDVIAFTGSTTTTVDVPAGSSKEVRFDALAKSVGTARIQMRVKMGRETDAFEDAIPVRILVSPETVAAYGEAKPEARETVELPASVVPGFGGLRVELSSTALVGLGEGARYLIEYPYGCAEQRASATLALVLASDLGEAFKLPGIDPTKTKEVAQTNLNELRKFQCGDGGFAFWPDDCTLTSPYLTSYVVHVFQQGKGLGYTVDADMLTRAYEYLERNLNEPRPPNEGWWPAYTAWQAFAIKTLVEGGRNEDSHINRVYEYLDRMPVFGIAYLADALVAKGERGPRLAELHRRITNAILPEGGHAHVEELSDPYLLWFWNSNVRSTAVTLGTLVRHGENQELVTRLVRWLMRVRVDGRWRNTQENAWAMESLVAYYRKYEAEVPDFTAVVTANASALVRSEFRGRSSEAKVSETPMQQLRTQTSPLNILFQRQGTGTLYYLMRLRYASAERTLAAMNNGFSIERTYSAVDGDAPLTTFEAGQMIEVTLRIRNTKERRFVAVTDPIPAGTEPVETRFATTAIETVERDQQRQERTWMWWQRGGFDRTERHDDRVNVFAMRLAEGEHEYTYLLRATTAGMFMTAPAHVEEMYEPEVFGRTGSVVVEVAK